MSLAPQAPCILMTTVEGVADTAGAAVLAASAGFSSAFCEQAAKAAVAAAVRKNLRRLDEGCTSWVT